MITPYDDYPIHQTADPVAHPASGDPNHYDRYFFNGFTRDGSTFFAGAMGHYPNRGVVDAAFSVVSDGVQRSVFASGRMPLDRSTRIGPIAVEVLEPLRTLRLSVGANDFGLEADLRFAARTAVVEEPRNTITSGARRVMDSTRLTQWGTWTGEIRVEGRPLDLSAGMYGVRDRSWGIRTVGVQVPTNFEMQMPQLFWMWAPLHFESFCTHLALFEYADGRRWLEQALLVPVIEPEAPTWGGEPDLDHLEGVRYDIDWKPGTRVASAASLHFTSRSRGEGRIDLEPLYTFRMRGIGYTHPTWGHGSLHGELEVGGESFGVDEFDPLDPSSIHVQSVCRARMGEHTGIGVLEQLCFGDHRPTGLTGLVDPPIR
ncbi:MAG TPA: hypothetical protein VFH58_10805 [Acidimicrobiales bacterium]|nr:hypothetical protein [Acidimicrobiales bacterium]